MISEDEIFEINGYKVFIRRVYYYLCGYVVLPDNHRFLKIRYEKIPINCHGGITYKGETEYGFVIGFDCNHVQDDPRFGGYPKGKEFDKNELINITRQLKTLEGTTILGGDC